MCLTLLGGGGGSRPSQTMSDFWPDFFLQTAPKQLKFIAFRRIIRPLGMAVLVITGGPARIFQKF